MQSPTTPTTTRSRTSNHDAMMVDPAPTTPPPSTSMSTELTLSPPPPPRPRRPRLRVVVSSSSSQEDGHDLFLSDRLFIPNVNDEVALQATTTRSPPLVVSSSSTSLPFLEIPIVSIMERGIAMETPSTNVLVAQFDETDENLQRIQQHNLATIATATRQARCNPRVVSLQESSSSSCCSICLNDFRPGEELGRSYHCSHIFHAACIQNWLLVHPQRSCPCCRQAFASPTPSTATSTTITPLSAAAWSPRLCRRQEQEQVQLLQQQQEQVQQQRQQVQPPTPSSFQWPPPPRRYHTNNPSNHERFAAAGTTTTTTASSSSSLHQEQQRTIATPAVFLQPRRTLLVPYT